MKVLELLYLLIKYGYYSNSEHINALMPSLLSLLNGVKDKPYPHASNEGSNQFRMVATVNAMIKYLYG